MARPRAIHQSPGRLPIRSQPLPTRSNRGLAEAAAPEGSDAVAEALDVERFLADPAELLKQNPGGGPALSDDVSRLVVADDRTIDGILALAKGATSRVQAAIGRGLAKAALVLVETRPERAAKLQERVAASGIDMVQIAFRVEQNDIDTAALQRLPGDGGAAPPAGTPAQVIRAADGPAVSGGEAATAGGAGNGVAAAPAPGEIASAGGISTGFLDGLDLAETNGGGDTSPLSPTR